MNVLCNWNNHQNALLYVCSMKSIMNIKKGKAEKFYLNENYLQTFDFNSFFHTFNLIAQIKVKMHQVVIFA